MFAINDDMSIYVTRGDAVTFSVAADENGNPYIFKVGDVVRFKVFEKKACENVVLMKDFPVDAETEEVTIHLNCADTKFGDVISKPTDYWYEVELNPESASQTILGYDEDGAKIFKLYPEGADVEDLEKEDVLPYKEVIGEAVEDWLEENKDEIKGEKGDTGQKGADGSDYILTEEDKKEIASMVEVTGGSGGTGGENGKDGVSCTHSWNGTVLTVTSASGTSSADLKGEKGDKGDTGEQGVQGEKGEAGSDANVTAENIETALGYVPVGNTDYATSSIGGVVKVGGDSAGIKLNADKMLTIAAAGNSEIDAMASANRPITPYYLQRAVKVGLCKNALEWTEEEKESARKVIGAQGTNAIPDYWLEPLETGAKEINTLLTTVGRNKSSFLFYSDSHWNYGSQMSPKLLKYLHEHTGITKTFFGGDIVETEADDYDSMEYLWEWREQLKGLPNHHSVVGNHDDGNATNNRFSEQYVYGYLIAPEETPDMVCGDEGIYYYIDHSPEKTRYIFLDTAYIGMTSNQIDFLKEALKSTKDGWHIVVVSHIWYMPDYDRYSERPVPLTGLGTEAVKVTTQLDAYNSRTGDYADCGGWVEFCIGGHVHYDYDGTTDTGIPIILVETDSAHTRGNFTYTLGTATESAVSGIIADYDNHKIHVVRIGRGESREIEVTNYVVSYTNLLDTVGYEVDQEYSTSSYTQRESSSGYDLTGWIELTEGESYYFKNITAPDNVTSRANMTYLFNADKSWKGNVTLTTDSTNGGIDWSPVFGADGNLYKITVPTGYTGCWMRCNFELIDEISIITRNEPIE